MKVLTLGQKIKMARKDLGLTQAELVGDRITRNQLSLIENGINNPSIPTLEFLAERIGKPVSYFLSDDDFLKHEAISIINKCEHMNEHEDYQGTINTLEAFLQRIDLSEFHYDDLLGKIYALLGEAYLKLGDSRSEELLTNAIKYLNKDLHQVYICKTYNNLGCLASKKEDYINAEEYYTRGNNTLSEISLDNIVLKLNVTYNLAKTYSILRKHDRIIPFVNEILQYSKKYKIYHNFGEFKMILSNALANNSNYKEAINCMMKALEYFTFTSEDVLKNYCYTNLGIFYRMAKDYQNSLRHLEQSIVYFKMTDNYRALINSKAEKIKTLFFMHHDQHQVKELVGEIFNSVEDSQQNKADLLTILAVQSLESGEIDDAQSLFSNAEELFAKNPNSEFYPYANLGLSKIFKYNGDWERAYQYLSKANESRFEIKRRIKFE